MKYKLPENWMTAGEFQRAVAMDPYWADKLTEPVDVAGFIKMEGSPIRRLSPLIHFSPSAAGDCVSFANCGKLENAAGVFYGTADFSDSAIETTEGLTVITASDKGVAARFTNCPRLKIATGKFPGSVCYRESGISEIRDLEITTATKNGEAANFFGCKNLKILTGKFPGFVHASESGVESIKGLEITGVSEGLSALFQGCPHLTTAEGTFHGVVEFSQSPIQTIGELKLEGPDAQAVFLECPTLKTIPREWFSRNIIVDPDLRRFMERTILKEACQANTMEI